MTEEVEEFDKLDWEQRQNIANFQRLMRHLHDHKKQINVVIDQLVDELNEGKTMLRYDDRDLSNLAKNLNDINLQLVHYITSKRFINIMEDDDEE